MIIRKHQCFGANFWNIVILSDMLRNLSQSSLNRLLHLLRRHFTHSLPHFQEKVRHIQTLQLPIICSSNILLCIMYKPVKQMDFIRLFRFEAKEQTKDRKDRRGEKIQEKSKILSSCSVPGRRYLLIRDGRRW